MLSNIYKMVKIKAIQIVQTGINYCPNNGECFCLSLAHKITDFNNK